MSWTVAQIHRRLVDLDESDRIEGKTGLGDAAMKSVSAFSNEVGLRGGWIVFGVQKDDDGQYETVGVKDPDQLQADLATRCRGVFNQLVDATIKVDLIDGKRVVIAFIPEVRPSDKPIYIKKKGLPKGAFRRVGSTDSVVSDVDLSRLASLASSVPFDRRPARGARRSDIDKNAIDAYRRQLSTGRPGSELLLMNDDELLEAVGALDEHRQPTNAGLVLFGTRTALRRLMPSLRIDVLSSESSDLDDEYHVVEVRESLVTGWQRVFQAVSETLPKRVTLTNDSMRRMETRRVPDLALREAIVNALIHRDLEVGSPIQIRRFPDRLEIENPGFSLAAEADWERSRSVARNTTVAQAFTELNLAETRGTGMRRMRTRMAAAGLAPPELISDREGNWFLLKLKFHHLLDEADWSWLERFPALDDADRQVLVVALRDNQVRNEDVRLITGAGVLSASHRLTRLRDLGLLEQHGSSKSDTWYTLTSEAQPSNLEGQPSNLGGQSSNLRGQSSNLGGQSSNLGGQSSNLGAPQPNEGTQGWLPGVPRAASARVPQDIQGIPTELRRRIASLSSRPDKAEVEQLLLEVCSLGWWEPTSLARAMGRTRRYLTQHYLQPMVADGRLRLRFPKSKHNPRQAYTIGEGADS